MILLILLVGLIPAAIFILFAKTFPSLSVRLALVFFGPMILTAVHFVWHSGCGWPWLQSQLFRDFDPLMCSKGTWGEGEIIYRIVIPGYLVLMPITALAAFGKLWLNRG